MRGVIFEIVAGDGVNQHVELAPVRVEPRDQSFELRRVERELTAPARMRAHELLMHAAHGDAEALRGLCADRPRLFHRLLVKVDVGVIFSEEIARALNGR